MIVISEHPALERWLAENIDSAHAGDALMTIINQLVRDERERCSTIVHNHQIAFCSDACGWALDKIKDGLPPNAARIAGK